MPTPRVYSRFFSGYNYFRTHFFVYHFPMIILHTDCYLFDLLTEREINIVRKNLDTPNSKILDITMEEFYTLLFVLGSDVTMLIKMHAICLIREKYGK